MTSPDSIRFDDYAAAFDKFVEVTTDLGVARDEAVLMAEQSRLLAISANAEQFPSGSLDLLDGGDRRERAARIGRDVAYRTLGIGLEQGQ